MLLEFDDTRVKKLLYINFLLLLIDIIFEISNQDLQIVRLPIAIFSFFLPGFTLFTLVQNNKEIKLLSALLSIIGLTISYNLICGLLIGYFGLFNELFIIVINLFFSSVLIYHVTNFSMDVKITFDFRNIEFKVMALFTIALTIRWLYILVIYSISVPEWDDNYAHMGRILALIDSETILDSNLPMASEISERPGNYNPSYPPGLYVLYGIISIRANISVIQLYELMFYVLTLIETLVYFELGSKLKNNFFGGLLALFSTSLIHSGFYHGVYWVVPDFLSMLFVLFVINELWSNNTHRFVVVVYSVTAIFTHYVGIGILGFLFVKIFLEDFEYLKKLNFKAFIMKNVDSFIILSITMIYYFILLFSEGSIINLILKGNDGLPIEIKHHLKLYFLQFQFYFVFLAYFSISLISSQNKNKIPQTKKIALFWLLLECGVMIIYFGELNSNFSLWIEFAIIRVFVIPFVFIYEKPTTKINITIIQTSLLFALITLGPAFVFGFALYFMAISSKLLMIISLYIGYSYLEIYGNSIRKLISTGLAAIIAKQYSTFYVRFTLRRKHVFFTTLISLFFIVILLTGIILNFEKALNKRNDVLQTDIGDEDIITRLKTLSGEIIYDGPRTYSYFLGREVFNHPIFQNLTEIPWEGDQNYYVIFDNNWNRDQIQTLNTDYILSLTGENFKLYLV